MEPQLLYKATGLTQKGEVTLSHFALSCWYEDWSHIVYLISLLSG